MENIMQVYTDPQSLVKDLLNNNYLLKISSKECKVLLEALECFDNIDASNKPSTESLVKAITEIDKALQPVATTNVAINGYEAQAKCEPCQD
tara:strand:- start:3371 stop:3646 length:276 start_codon:yes stop_codon:yes gene_type:complete